MKKYGMPVLVALVGALLVRLVDAYLSFPGVNDLVTILRVMVLFGFGLTLNQHGRRRNESWVKKLVIAFVVFFFVCWELGYIVFPELKAAFNFLGIYGFVVNMVYVYCGWCFFD